MIRHAGPTSARRSHAPRWLAVAVVGAVLVAAGGTGCHPRSGPQPGGATTSKAQAARKQAETCAIDAVKAVAAAEVASHPELKKKNIFVTAASRLHLDRIHLFGKTTTSASTTPPPAPPSPPVPPTPPVVSRSPAPPAGVIDRTEPPIRAAARAASPVVIRERVVSEIPYPTESEAEDRVLRDAQDRIERKLRELDPPVVYRPSLADVKEEYLRRDSRVVRPPTDREIELLKQIGYGPDRKYVEYNVEVTADQVRALRTRERLVTGVRGVGIVAAVALAGFLFLRLDEWTKGYLTSWLALGAAALAGGVATALVLYV